jgi:histidine phosphotransfer protein HptB
MNSPKTNATQSRIVVFIDADLEELIPNYLHNRHQDVQALKAALIEGNFERLRLLGHGMKGSGGGYGFDRITELGAALETAAIRQEKSALGASIAQLQDFLERLDISYQ